MLLYLKDKEIKRTSKRLALASKFEKHVNHFYKKIVTPQLRVQMKVDLIFHKKTKMIYVVE